MPAAIGFVQRLSAMPQCAIAHVESRDSTVSKAAMAELNSNECRSATPRSNVDETAGAHDVAKWTAPSFSGGAALCACVCARAV